MFIPKYIQTKRNSVCEPRPGLFALAQWPGASHATFTEAWRLSRNFYRGLAFVTQLLPEAWCGRPRKRGHREAETPRTRGTKTPTGRYGAGIPSRAKDLRSMPENMENSIRPHGPAKMDMLCRKKGYPTSAQRPSSRSPMRTGTKRGHGPTKGAMHLCAQTRSS